MKKRLLWICTIAVLIVTVSGCVYTDKDTGDSVSQFGSYKEESENSEDSDDQTVYTYKESEVGDVNLSKTVYEDN